MSHPLPVGHRTVTARWKYSDGKIHAAYDYRCPIGTQVSAVRKGHILKVVDHIPNMAPSAKGESGNPPNYVLQSIMFKGEPATVVYLHVSPHVPVHEGDPVSDGQKIALSGHNGYSLGPHLHIAVVKGLDHLDDPFHYLSGLGPGSPEPLGIAANGITIFPPRLTYTPGLPASVVLMRDLRFGTKHSESVRRLQARLNLINLPGSVHMSLTGNYSPLVRTEVKRWQKARFNHPPGSPLDDGNLRREQAKILFKDSGITVR